MRIRTSLPPSPRNHPDHRPDRIGLHAAKTLLFGARFLLPVLGGPIAFAGTQILGPDARIEALPQNCEIAIYSAGTLSEFCSGTLTAPQVVTTAAHCINGAIDTDPDVSYRVRCGFTGMLELKSPWPAGSQTAVYTETQVTRRADFDPLFRKEAKGPHDTGHLYLPEKSKIEPKRPVSSAEATTVLASPATAEFRLFATGTDSSSLIVPHSAPIFPLPLNGAEGILHAGAEWKRIAGSNEVRRAMANEYVQYQTGKLDLDRAIIDSGAAMRSTAVIGGDSGGGLFFRTDKTAPWRLIATVSNVQSTFATTIGDHPGPEYDSSDAKKRPGAIRRGAARADAVSIVLDSRFSLIDPVYDSKGSSSGAGPDHP